MGGGSPNGFDLAAASERRAGVDARAFAEALAARLEPALPGRVTVERRRDGLFSSARHVSAIRVRFEDATLELSFEGGQPVARCAKAVRGVTLSTREMTVPEWLADLGARARALGEGAEAGRAALDDFLLG